MLARLLCPVLGESVGFRSLVALSKNPLFFNISFDITKDNIIPVSSGSCIGTPVASSGLSFSGFVAASSTVTSVVATMVGTIPSTNYTLCYQFRVREFSYIDISLVSHRFASSATYLVAGFLVVFIIFGS